MPAVSRALVPFQGNGPGSSGGSSGPATPRGLRRLLEQEYDPAKETKDQWQSRLLRGVAQLERFGTPLPDDDIEKLIVKGSYAEELAGLDLQKQVHALKRMFSEVLFADERYEEREYNIRLAALMEMLRSRGTEPSGSVNRLFSASATWFASLTTSPEKREVGGSVGQPGVAAAPRGVRRNRQRCR